MPEGDTIFRTADALRRWIGGRELTAVRSARAGVDLAPLVGQRVESVEARAKHLLIRFSGGLTLHTHMVMTGSWHVYPTGERWRKPSYQARVVLECGSRTAVCFAAPVVEQLDDDGIRVQRSLRQLGPDVLGGGEPVPAAELRRRTAARAEHSPTVAELLLDQQVVSGIGNIYRCEALFACRVEPHTASTDIEPTTLEDVVATASRLMAANARTSAIARHFDTAPRPWVYRRAGRPCRRCGATVQREVHGRNARALYWCPGCQTRS